MNIKTFVKHGAAVSVAALMASFGTPAFAQATPTPAPQAEDGIGDIIVTARRREESLQKVPIAITALRAEDLADRSIRLADDLKFAVPGLDIRQRTEARVGTAVITVRGQTSALDQAVGLDNSVIFYYDDVAAPRAAGNIAGLYDVANVQVLKGPQGTLFGRNTTGGAILVNSQMPTDRLEGYLSGTVGSFGRTDTNGALNIPITDGLSFRAAYDIRHTDGYSKNLGPAGGRFGDVNQQAARAILRWDISSDTQLTGKFEYANINSGSASITRLVSITPNSTDISAAAVATGCAFANVATPACQTAGLAYINNLLAVEQAAGRYDVYVDVINALTPKSFDTLGYQASMYGKFRSYSYQATLTHDFGGAKLKINAGMRSYEEQSLIDADRTGLPTTVSELFTHGYRSHSLEATINADPLDNRLHLTAGAYYFDEKADEDGGLSFSNVFSGNPAASSDTRSAARNKSYAGYAQATFDILPNLHFTAGGRYTHEKRAADLRIKTYLGVCGVRDPSNPNVFLPDNACSLPIALDFNAFTYTLALAYEPTDKVSIYATHRKGFKSGGINTRSRVASPSPAFKPEFVLDYELGVKADWNLAGMPVRTNIAGYYSDYSDIQLTDTVCIIQQAPVNNACVGGGQTTSTFNAAKARIYGLEFEGTARPFPGAEISVGVNHANAKYQSFNVPAGLFRAAGPIVDRSGQYFGGPQWTYNLSGSFDLKEAAQSLPVDAAVLRFDYYWQSRVPNNDPLTMDNPVTGNNGLNKPYGLLNGRFSLQNIANSNVSLSLWGRNLLNKYVGTYQARGGNRSVVGGPLQPVTMTQFNLGGQPQEFGVELKVKFGS